MFSQYLKYLLEKLQFLKVVISRFLIILFRKRREIELLHLNYDKEHLFDTSYIVINYRFRNAIYYRFGKHITLEKKIKIFNIKNFGDEFDLIVYGFFQLKQYKIQFEPQYTLNSDNFKTTISNVTIKLEERKLPKLVHPNLNCIIEKPLINSESLKITTKIYNQNEFI